MNNCSGDRLLSNCLPAWFEMWYIGVFVALSCGHKCVRSSTLTILNIKIVIILLQVQLTAIYFETGPGLQFEGKWSSAQYCLYSLNISTASCSVKITIRGQMLFTIRGQRLFTIRGQLLFTIRGQRLFTIRGYSQLEVKGYSQ